MDDPTKYNIARWKALVEANAVFTRPALSLDPISARNMIDPEGRLGDVASKDVLCLACGGGKQSIALAMLKANVTILDLSEAQLSRDREAALHFGLDIKIRQGDMRDLSPFEEAAFDIVYHGCSLGLVPNARTVFQQVARVLRPGGIYKFMCANPFFLGTQEKDWNGEGYTIKHPYVDGAEITYDDQEWVYDRSKSGATIPPPREFRHTLSELIGGLVEQGFIIQHVSDRSDFNPDPHAEPGTWAHFVSIAPPWLSFWSGYRPNVLFPRNPATGAPRTAGRLCFDLVQHEHFGGSLMKKNRRAIFLRAVFIMLVAIPLLTAFCPIGISGQTGQPSDSGSYGMTSGRLAASSGVVLGLIGTVIGVLALVRPAGLFGTASGRLGAFIALAAGLIGTALGALVAATSGGRIGTGGGLLGAIVAIVLGLIATALGGFAMARSRRTA